MIKIDSLYSMVKYICIKLLTMLFILIFLFGIWILWERNRDPLIPIDIDPGKVDLFQDTPFELSFQEIPERSYRHIKLNTEYLGKIEVLVSQPTTIPKEGLPVVIIMGGLEIDESDFALITDPGDNIYVIYKYPYTPEYWYRGTAIIEMPIIRSALLNVPAQALTMYQWVSKQKWAKKDHTHFAGFSFGALFIPSIYHIAHSHHQTLNPAIIAYGGADISELLYTNMRKVEEPWRTFGAWIGESVIYPIEPAHHLPHLNNEFLFINGTKDHQISTYSSNLLHDLTPVPKTIVILEEGHMHPKKPELTKKIVDISKKWFRERALIN